MDVTDIEVGDEGIRWLELSDGLRVKGDLYIDCTGFKSMLLEGALGVPFLDYSNVIPNNIAWATHMPYLDKEKELVGYTNCTAMENGWVWNIPLWSRIGAGYVYSDKFVTDEAALEEFKSHIRKTGRDPETLEYKKIVMRNGIHEKIWHKNVVGIGLAAGFIEPLESTGLWFTHEFAYTLLRILFRGAHPKQHDRDMFNTMIKFQWDEMVKFICQHYAFSARTDTEYWRNIAKLDFPIDKNLCIASIEQMDRYYTGWPGIHAILAGLEYHVYDETYFWQRVYPKTQDWKKIYKKEFSELDRGIKSWTEEASRAPSLLHVLSKIHDNKLSE
jgi:tryptophan halogenase